ncbi:MAG: hypothetical protein MK078_16160 [Crocinitomicaceae bacterium]|nr:hypothetical protein [Crocinitomicaceae bacterium]
MPGFKRVLVVLLIFLGPGLIIYFIATTVRNKFIEPPYLGYEYIYDEEGNVEDSTAYQIPEFELTRFDGVKITRDSIQDKFIILTTIQNPCPDLDQCALGIYMFNELLFEKILKTRDSYENVRVMSILTDENGQPIYDPPSEVLMDEMSQYDPHFWWLVQGDPKPFYNWSHKGQNFLTIPSQPSLGEIGKYDFTNCLVLIDKDGYIRGISGAKRDGDIRNFFDFLKLLKKIEFDKAHGIEY